MQVAPFKIYEKQVIRKRAENVHYMVLVEGQWPDKQNLLKLADRKSGQGAAPFGGSVQYGQQMAVVTVYTD